MKFVIISSSHRKEGASGRVARVIAAEIETAGHTTTVVDLAKNPLPLWDESMWGAEGVAKPAWEKVFPELQAADGFVVLAPEYNGTAPANLKNFFHYTSVVECAHKPALLVGVTATGVNGTYPIAELHMSGTKNNKMVLLPDHLIIRNVNEILKETPEDPEADAYTRNRLGYSLALLYAYAEALRPVRKSDLWQKEEYNFGQ